MNIVQKNTLDDVKAFIQKSPHPCAIKDRNSVFIQANANYARLVGLKNSEDFLGRTDFDLPCGASRCAPLFLAQDQDVIRTPHVMKVLDVQPEAGEKWHAFFTTKTVFWNSKGEIGGTFVQMQDITSQATLQFCFSLGKSTPYTGEGNFANQFSYMLGTPKNSSLTERQGQVLFFLIRRYSLKKIALALDLSLKTISAEVEKLKDRFKASNMSELIDKSITQGCINLIPRGLSYRQMSITLQAD